jgi:hypothetical protein
MTRFKFSERAQAVAANLYNDRPGDWILKPGKAYLYSPGYDMAANKDGITVFRILPRFEPGDGTPQNPGRFTPFYDGDDFGDWIRVYQTIEYFGNDPDNQASFILDDGMGTTNAPQYPTAVLRKAVQRALQAGTDPGGWHRYVEGQKPFLPDAKARYFVQVLLVHLNKQLDGIKGLNGKPYVLKMSQSAGNALVSLVKTPITEATLAQRAASQDPIQLHFEHGDPVSLYDGRWIVMYKAGNGDPRTRQAGIVQQAQPTMFGQQAMAQPQSKEERAAFAEKNSYACYCQDQFYNIPANFVSGAAEQQSVAATTQPWEDLLYFPTIEQQVELCATRVPYQMLEYAFQNRPDWLHIARKTLKLDEVSMGWGSTHGPTQAPTTAPNAFAGVPAGPAVGAVGAFGGAQPTQPAFNGMPFQGAPVATGFGGAPAAPAAPQAFAQPAPAATVFPNAQQPFAQPPAQQTGFPSGPAPVFGGGVAAQPAPAVPTVPAGLPVANAPMANVNVFGQPAAAMAAQAEQANYAAASLAPPPAQAAQPAGPFTPPPMSPNANAMLTGMAAPTAFGAAPIPPAAAASATPLAAAAFAVMQAAAGQPQAGPAVPAAPAAGPVNPADDAPF